MGFALPCPLSSFHMGVLLLKLKIKNKSYFNFAQTNTEIYFRDVRKDQISDFKSEVQSSPEIVEPLYILPYKTNMKYDQI